MPVSSDCPAYTVELVRARRDDFDELLAVWSNSKQILSHSRGPAVIAGFERDRDVTLWKLFDDDRNLVAYFPFEVKKCCGITIFQPFLKELTLDFIELSVEASWSPWAYEIFKEWIATQKNCVVDIFMSAEDSPFTETFLDDNKFKVQARGKYFFIDLPTSLDEYFASLGKSTRSKLKRAVKAHDPTIQFEVVRSNVKGDEMVDAFNDMVRLHKFLFPTGSMMLPHEAGLLKYVQTSSRDDSWIFFRGLDRSTGEVVVIDLYMNSPQAIGLYQGGRNTDKKYSGIGNWMMIKCIEWAVAEGKPRFEFLFGDQQYKKQMASGVRDAVSVTYFSSSRARYTYRIRQRLGHYIAALR